MVVKPQLKIYAEQWGIFWRFTPENFRDLLTKAINTGHYDLDKLGRQLKGVPKSVYEVGSDRVNYTTRPGSNAFLFRMVDKGNIILTFN